jgi:hypothetical protein
LLFPIRLRKDSAFSIKDNSPSFIFPILPDMEEYVNNIIYPEVFLEEELKERFV